MPTSNDATYIQNFQDGGRIPEVIITLRQKTTSRCYPLPWVSTISDFGEQYQVKTEVETVPQTGSTNNITTETDIDAISVAISMFLGASLSLVYTLPTYIQNFQDGGRIPEAIITLRQKTTSRCFQRLRQCFRARPIHFHRFRQYPTLENSIRYKAEVKTVPETGSTNNLTTETDIDAILVATPMFWGESLSLVYIPNSPDASFAQKFQDGGWIPEVVITFHREQHQGALGGCSNVLGHVRSTSTGVNIVRFRRTASGTNRK